MPQQSAALALLGSVYINNRCGWCLQDRINSLALSGPYTLSANDLLCSMLWHASCMVRNRTNTTGIFHMMFDLQQMHTPDDYFGNAHCVLSVSGEEPCVQFNSALQESVVEQMYSVSLPFLLLKVDALPRLPWVFLLFKSHACTLLCVRLSQDFRHMASRIALPPDFVMSMLC